MSKLPAPTVKDGLTQAEVDTWHRNQAVLEADARTSGSQPRPRWLVERVLAEHAARSTAAEDRPVVPIPDAHRVLINQGMGKLAAIAIRAKESPTTDARHLLALAQDAERHARTIREALEAIVRSAR